MPKYELVLHVYPADITKALSSGRLISLKEIEEVPKPSLLPHKKSIPPRHKGTLTGEEIINKIMADGRIHTSGEITAESMAHGFKKNSISPRLSTMVKNNQLIMLGDGKYQKKGK